MRCPRCNHEVGQGQSRCPDCGYELPDTSWDANPNVFHGFSSGSARSASSRDSYIYNTAAKQLIKSCGAGKILAAIVVLIGLIVLIGLVL